MDGLGEKVISGGSYHITTLGCPKNEVDSEKLAGRLAEEGLVAAPSLEEADLVVVNTCAFIEAARAESVETILAAASARRPGARLAVTGCLAERSPEELRAALPEVDVVAGFGCELTASVVPVALRGRKEISSFDLLELPRPPGGAPWAYVKVAEGCDRRCGFCAIPSFRGPQRSRRLSSIIDEVERLSVREVVLVAQDLASYGHDRSSAERHAGEEIVTLVKEVQKHVDWVRLLYIYPSALTDAFIDAVLGTGVAYFDLSLQHVSAPLLRRMRRFGNRKRLSERIARIRELEPQATLRSSFILGYPGETEEDHDELLSFLSEVELDWGGFFTFSREEGTYADGLSKESFVPPELAAERRDECAELQDVITASRRARQVGRELDVLVTAPEAGRSYMEAPDIDGVVQLLTEPGDLFSLGELSRMRVVDSFGPDLIAKRAG